jgi:hypothetical protein
MVANSPSPNFHPAIWEAKQAIKGCSTKTSAAEN